MILIQPSWFVQNRTKTFSKRQRPPQKSVPKARCAIYGTAFEETFLKSFEPKILAFSCNWCSYTSADLAGINRYKYPHNVNIVRFMCSGRIEPEIIMKAFEYGADGVIVKGCRLDECHYISGNYRAKERIETTQHLLDMKGIGAGRLSVAWLRDQE